MDIYYLTFRSITAGQRAQRYLKRYGLDCRLVRTPKSIADTGCGYSLLLRQRELVTAGMLLRQGQLTYGRLYHLAADGSGEEAAL